MEFVKSKYYNKELLGKYLYENIKNRKEIFTVQEYFEINNNKKEYHIKGIFGNYKLKICEDYYELNCFKYYESLLLVFDKPVHIAGEYCKNIIAPEIVIKSIKNQKISLCIANNVIINNNINNNYDIKYSKINNVYFYNKKVTFEDSEINNFFIFDKKIKLYKRSKLLKPHKIKCFGSCDDLKKQRLKSKYFKEGIIHIE